MRLPMGLCQLQAIAARLNHGRAGLVAARAANAAAVLGVFALANTDGEIALAAGDAVECATAAAEPVSQHAAEVLQRAAGHFVVAAAMDLAAVRGLFEFDRAAWQYTPIGRLWRTNRNRRYRRAVSAARTLVPAARHNRSARAIHLYNLAVAVTDGPTEQLWNSAEVAR